MPRRIALAIVAAVFPAAAMPATPHRTHVVVIDAMTFKTPALTIAPGDTVTWVNRDMFEHTATARGHFDVDLKPREKKSVTFPKPDVFAYFCRFHPGMKGTITVRPG